MYFVSLPPSPEGLRGEEVRSDSVLGVATELRRRGYAGPTLEIWCEWSTGRRTAAFTDGARIWRKPSGYQGQ